jgi:hypothetical protein
MVLRSEYTRLRGWPCVGSHVDNQEQPVGIRHWIEYGCGVITEVCLNVITEQGNTRLYS